MSISKNVFHKRLEKLFALMKREEVAAMIIECPLDLFYLTGLKLSCGILLVHQKERALFLDGRYIDVARQNSFFSVRAREEGEFSKYFATISCKQGERIGFDQEKCSYANYLVWEKRLEKSQATLKGVPSLVKELRMIKESRELLAIRKSAALLWEGFEAARLELKEGIREREVAFFFEMFSKKRGATALSFDPIVAFGANSAFPHHITGERTLQKGDLVLLDLGVMVDGYASDMTRVLFFGSPQEKLSHLYQIVLRAQTAALSLCKEGARGSDLDRAAREVMQEEGVEKHYLHSLGHGIGLEVHESPRLSISSSQEVVLREGMVVSIEPGLYLPDIGGVRIEDMVVITKNGYESFFPKVSLKEAFLDG